MQRGSLLQPFAQQNSFCQGRLALTSFGAQPGTGSRDSHGNGLRRTHPFSLVPIHRKRQTTLWAVFLSAFLQKPSLLSRGKPRRGPASPSAGGYALASPLFPIAVTVSCWLLRRCRNRASPLCSQVKWGGGLTPEPSPAKTGARSGHATRSGEPRLPVRPHAVIVRTLPMVFSGPDSSVQPQQPFPRRRISSHPSRWFVRPSVFRPLSSDF